MEFKVFRHYLNPKVAVLRIKKRIFDDLDMWFEGYVIVDGRDIFTNAIIEFRNPKGTVLINLIKDNVYIRKKRPAGDIDRLAMLAREFLIQVISLAPIFGKSAVWVAQKAVCPNYANSRNKCFHYVRRHLRRNSWAPESIELLLLCLSRKKSLDVATEKDRTVKTAMQTVGTS